MKDRLPTLGLPASVYVIQRLGSDPANYCSQILLSTVHAVVHVCMHVYVHVSGCEISICNCVAYFPKQKMNLSLWLCCDKVTNLSKMITNHCLHQVGLPLSLIR